MNPKGLTIVDLSSGAAKVDIRTVLGDSFSLTVPAQRESKSTQHKLDRVREPRVQITYEVEVGGAIESREVPFVVGVMAKLSGTQTAAPPPLRDRKFVQIDSDTFDQVMESINPRLSLRMENRLDKEAGDLLAELRFDAIADFEPASVARQVGPMRELLESRSQLQELRTMIVGDQSLRAELERILTQNSRGQVMEGSLAEPEPLVRAIEQAMATIPNTRSYLAQELAFVFRKSVSTPSESQDLEEVVDARIAEIDSRLSDQMNVILHHRDFQALEATWRGLHYLVWSTETSAGLKIEVWDVDKEELAHDLTSAPEFDRGDTFKKIYEEEFGVFNGEPFGLLLGAYEFGRSPDDVELLERISKMAATSKAPFLAAASAAMLGLESFSELRDAEDVSKLFSSPEAERWNNLRKLDTSRYVGLTLPRILLRSPYGATTRPVEEFSFEECVTESDPSLYLWGNAAFALASRITTAFARYGWPAAIRGVENGGLVEGLLVYNCVTDSGDVVLKGSIEIAISDRRERELSEVGFIPLLALKGTDSACFLSVSSVGRHLLYDTPEANANARCSFQLPYVLAMTRFAQYFKCMMRDNIGGTMSRSQMERYLNTWISNYVLDDDNTTEHAKAERPLRQACIDVEEHETTPGAYRAIAYLRPHFQLDELTVALRQVIDFPSLVSTGRVSWEDRDRPGEWRPG